MDSVTKNLHIHTFQTQFRPGIDSLVVFSIGITTRVRGIAVYVRIDQASMLFSSARTLPSLEKALLSSRKPVGIYSLFICFHPMGCILLKWSSSKVVFCGYVCRMCGYKLVSVGYKDLCERYPKFIVGYMCLMRGYIEMFTCSVSHRRIIE